MAIDLQIQARHVVSVNPATGEILHEIECASDSEVRAAVARARAAQSSWAALAVAKRVSMLREFQTQLHARKSEVAKLITREAGKPYVEALLTEVLVVLDATQFLIENARELLREQHGVIGIVSPWNYPFSIPAVEALAALVTGNAVLLKPSEFTTLVGLELELLLR